MAISDTPPQTVVDPFLDPRPLPRSRVSWVSEAAWLRVRHGEWVVLVTRETRAQARTMASQINRGVLWAFQPAGDFEAWADGSVVKARFLGDGLLPELRVLETEAS